MIALISRTMTIAPRERRRRNLSMDVPGGVCPAVALTGWRARWPGRALVARPGGAPSGARYFTNAPVGSAVP
ncbi:hypothetical protein GCM10010507_62980 [Streptomyces cinnamoneus]|uniref:Uncharacterized protein n=1 Tax=Streptomyces cinnamoneus TaxID=53446 RepID=A0A918WRQ8_STRCJ|nr:hypothetical protein GCM10010507_62980 [Streptomyces cinnamoneus]